MKSSIVLKTQSVCTRTYVCTKTHKFIEKRNGTKRKRKMEFAEKSCIRIQQLNYPIKYISLETILKEK